MSLQVRAVTTTTKEIEAKRRFQMTCGTDRSAGNQNATFFLTLCVQVGTLGSICSSGPLAVLLLRYPIGIRSQAAAGEVFPLRNAARLRDTGSRLLDSAGTGVPERPFSFRNRPLGYRAESTA